MRKGRGKVTGFPVTPQIEEPQQESRERTPEELEVIQLDERITLVRTNLEVTENKETRYALIEELLSLLIQRGVLTFRIDPRGCPGCIYCRVRK